MTLEPGAVLGDRFRLVERIGSGGMGMVFRAEDLESDGVEVAVKVVRAEVSSERALERFRREARFAASIRHPHVVEVRGYGVSDDHPYLAMELLEGQSLEERLEELPPPTVHELVGHLADALDGLAAVHAAGIVHRDLKPGNLFLARDGRRTVVKLLDFGLSRAVAETAATGEALPSLTQTHQFIGTPYYASPEQVRSAKRIDARSDLFSMGVILYEGLAGRRPFDGPSASAVIAAVVADDPTPIASLRPDLPAALPAVVHRALARDPSARFDDARAMRAALEVAKRGTESLRATPRLSGADTMPSSRGSSDMGRAQTLPTDRPPAPVVPARSGFGRALAIGLVAGVAIGGAWLHWGGALDGGDGASALPDPEPVDAVPLAAPPSRVGGPGSLGELAMRIEALPASSPRHELRVVREGNAWSVISPEGMHPAALRELAARFDAEPVPFAGALDGALSVEVVQTTASLNLRRQPGVEGELLRTLPRGAIVVAIHGGVVDGAASTLGGSGTWSYVVATSHDAGWSAARFLVRDGGCVPPTEELLRAAPEDARRALAGDLLLGRARIRADVAGYDAFIAVARDPERVRSYVLVYEHDAACRVTLRGTISVTGHVVDVILDRDRRRGRRDARARVVAADACARPAWSGDVDRVSRR